MLSPAQALAKAAAVKNWTVGMCDQFVSEMFGFNSSGYQTAVDNWNAVPAAGKHPGDMNAPAGALMFWGGGDGHVAISKGDGTIISTDIGGSGTVTTALATDIGTKWGKPYLGWSVPYFQGQVGTVGAVSADNGSTVTQASSVTPTSLTSDFLNSFLKTTFGDTTQHLVERLGLIVLGVVFVVVAVYKITGMSAPSVSRSSKPAEKTRTKESVMVEDA